jgi:hypothetical protein
MKVRGSHSRLPLVSLLFGLLLVFSLHAATPQNADRRDNDPLLLGNPSDAIASLLLSENLLEERQQYSLSYNRTKGVPIGWLGISKDRLGECRAPASATRRDSLSRGCGGYPETPSPTVDTSGGTWVLLKTGRTRNPNTERPS